MSFPKNSADPSSASGHHFSKIPSVGSRASFFGGGSFDPSFRPDPRGFRAREGYANIAPPKAPSRMYIPNTTWTWAFTIVTLVQTLVTLGLEWYVFKPGVAEIQPAHDIALPVTFLRTFRSKRRQMTVPLRDQSPPSSPSTVSVSSTSLFLFTMPFA